jgi:hypothetical protein
MTCHKHPDRECPPKKNRCDECLETLREYQRRRRKDLLAEGRCVGTVGRPKCQNPPRANKTMCQACADTFNEYQAGRIRARKRGER